MRKIKFAVMDVSMGNGHDGLNKILQGVKKANLIFARALKADPGLILFINRAKNKCKVMDDSGLVVGYLKTPHRFTQLNLDSVAATFGGSFEYSNSVKSALKYLLLQDKKRIRPKLYEEVG